MADPRMPSLTLYKTAREKKTLGFDFQRTGPVKAGETLSDPQFHIPSAAGVTVVPGSLAVLTQMFVDAADGSSIPPGQGTIIQLTGGVPGTYDVSCDCLASPSGDRPEIVGRLIITTAPG